MAVVGEVAQVVHANVEQPVLSRLADEGEVERSKVLGEDGDDVDAQRGHPVVTHSVASR